VSEFNSKHSLFLRLVPAEAGRIIEVIGWADILWEARSTPQIREAHHFPAPRRLWINEERPHPLRNRAMLILSGEGTEHTIDFIGEEHNTDEAHCWGANELVQILTELGEAQRIVSVDFDGTTYSCIWTMLGLRRLCLVEVPRWTASEWARFTVKLIRYRDYATLARMKGLQGRETSALEKSLKRRS